MADFVQILTDAFKDAGLDGVRAYPDGSHLAAEHLHVFGYWTDEQVYVKLHVDATSHDRISIWLRLERPAFSNETPGFKFEPVDLAFVTDHTINQDAIDQAVNCVIYTMEKLGGLIRRRKADKLDRLAEELDQSTRDGDGGGHG